GTAPNAPACITTQAAGYRASVRPLTARKTLASRGPTRSRRTAMTVPSRPPRPRPSRVRGSASTSATPRQDRVMGSAGLRGRLDLAAQDLPGRALRQLVNQPDLPRVLVGGDLVAGERAQFLRGRAGVRLQRHGRADFLAEVVVGYPDHGHLAHRRVLVQDFLDLAWVDVVAAPDDHVLLAVDNVEVAVLVDLGQVSAAAPDVGDRLGGGFWFLQRAPHHAWG